MLLEPSIRFAPDLAVGALNDRYAGAPAEDALHAALRLYAGRIALVSSFGADSAVLLHMAAQINPHVPVLIADTAMLFPQTLEYQQELAAWLGLTDVRRIALSAAERRARDPYGALHLADPDACCALRKVAPMAAALRPFEAQVTGRKRFQSGTRAAMKLFEADAGGRIRVNPLAAWSAADLGAYFDRHALPRHPLVARGYASIGCVPCTSRVRAGEPPRAGRWRGLEKTECGLHSRPTGQAQRIAT